MCSSDLLFLIQMSAIISGFTNPLATQIKTRTIHRNHELYKMYTDLFPFLGTGDDENRLLAKTGVIQVICGLREIVFLSSLFRSTCALISYNAFGHKRFRTILPDTHHDII